MLHFRTVAIIATTLLGLALNAGAQTVLTGFSVVFNRPAFVDWASPDNQDAITSNVILTRENSRGLFNIAAEGSYTTGSPADTEWAFAGLNDNPSVLSAADWDILKFKNWEESLGGPGLLADNILNRPGVLHLISENIYLDIQFTDWGKRPSAGGAFAYHRAAEPSTIMFWGLGGLAWLRRRRA